MMNRTVAALLMIVALAAGMFWWSADLRCRPGDRGTYIGGSFLVEGCPR